MGRLDNKVAIITEAGMGQAGALLFAREGAKVAGLTGTPRREKRRCG